MRILKQSHSAEKFKRGNPLGFFKLQFVTNYQKIEGDPLKAKKVRKSRTVPKKNERGDPSVSRFRKCSKQVSG